MVESLEIVEGAQVRIVKVETIDIADLPDKKVKLQGALYQKNIEIGDIAKEITDIDDILQKFSDAGGVIPEE